METNIFKYLILLVVVLFFSNCKVTKVSDLEKYYNQGHYKIVERKAANNLKNEEVKSSPSVYLYHAVSLAKLAVDSRYLSSNPDTFKKSYIAFESYYNLVKNKNISDKEIELMCDLEFIYSTQKNIKFSYEISAFLEKNTKDELLVRKKKIRIKKENSKSIKIRTKIQDSISLGVSKEDQMIAYAKQYIGVPYKYGGVGNGGFDCSGYTQYVLRKYGHEIPRSARYQKEKLKKIPIKKAKKGDLIFFSKNRRVISHVGIVISEEGEDLTMIHASSSRGIMITNVATNTYWKPKLMSAGRVAEN